MLNIASNLVLCCYIHQVTSCALYIMKLEAYDHYLAACNHRPPLPLSLWEQHQDSHPMFKFWNLILCLELTLFEFVKSLRTGNFHLYVDTSKSIAPWMFALDHHNYARWLPVHLNEMCQLKIRNPNIYTEFLAGKFVVQKSNIFQDSSRSESRARKCKNQRSRWCSQTYRR